MKRIIAAFVAFILLFVLPVTSYAGNCKYPGCTRKETPGPNRNGYCSVHDPRYQTDKYCIEKECHKERAKGSKYCSNHKWMYDNSSKSSSSASSTKYCIVSGCNKVRMTGSSYCSSHTCSKSGCYNKRTNGSYCSTHKNASNLSSKKKTNSKKMPDCDDYDSYEEFMDEWDGCMPDGSDAEDYWYNW